MEKHNKSLQEIDMLSLGKYYLDQCAMVSKKVMIRLILSGLIEIETHQHQLHFKQL